MVCGMWHTSSRAWKLGDGDLRYSWDCCNRTQGMSQREWESLGRYDDENEDHELMSLFSDAMRWRERKLLAWPTLDFIMAMSLKLSESPCIDSYSNSL